VFFETLKKFKGENKMIYIYARDLKKENQTDAFMGKGFEAMLKKAEDENKEFIIGEFHKNEDWFLE